MWFPPITPAAVAGRQIWLYAAFCGVGAVVRDGEIIAGPLFRADRDVFMLEAKNDANGMASLQFIPVNPADVFGLTAPDNPELPVPLANVATGEKPGFLEKLKSHFQGPAAVPPDSEML